MWEFFSPRYSLNYILHGKFNPEMDTIGNFFDYLKRAGRTPSPSPYPPICAIASQWLQVLSSEISVALCPHCTPYFRVKKGSKSSLLIRLVYRRIPILHPFDLANLQGCWYWGCLWDFFRFFQ